MNDQPTPTTRRQRRLAERGAVARPAARDRQQPRASRLRVLGFLVVAVAVIGGGFYLASSVFMGQRGTTNVAGATAMRISMDGFDPKVIDATAGQVVKLDWWNTDGAMHLQDGVHTMVSDALGLRLELPAESRKMIEILAPTTPGDYDFWCDSCCGGKENETMHGTLHVTAA